MDIKRKPKWKRWLKKAGLPLLAFLVAAVVISFVVQHFQDADFRATHPAPGSLVVVDGHQIHFRQSGDGDFTFVLEPGLCGYSGSWETLESSLAKIGRVFVYDRAGLGWSEESAHSRTTQQIAAELHAILEKVPVRKPFILVGHSMGGISQVLYAMDHPDEVAGLLLIDPAHKDQFKKLPAPPIIVTLLFPQITRAACFGLPQLLFKSTDPVQNQATHMWTSGAELRELLRCADTWGTRPLHLGNIPVYVLTAGDDKGMLGKSDAGKKAAWEILKALHAELVASSWSAIRKQVVVEGASHYIYRTNPTAVIEAAQEMVDRINVQKR